MKNRVADVLPFDNSRVELPTTKVQTTEFVKCTKKVALSIFIGQPLLGAYPDKK